MASIRCGKCKNTHASIAQVRECYTPVKVVAKTPFVPVPAGRYAVEVNGKLKFYVVQDGKGQWSGRKFVKVQASDELHKVWGQNARNAMDAIRAAGFEAASKRYGHELKSCGVCGRTLTDDDSRANGIGPICASKMGW